MTGAVPSLSNSRRLRIPAFIARDRGAQIGLFFLLLVLLVAILGPLFTPHPPDEPLGTPAATGVAGSPLGLDELGRDVLSRVLAGGLTTIALGAAATAATYVLGVTLGLIAGYARQSRIDGITMRSVDLFLSMPALLVMLLLITGLGNGESVLVLGAVIVLFPGVTRIVRTAASEVGTRNYVEAAVARGERPAAILRREILPNIMAPIIADLGVRFSWAIILIASVNFLGLGLNPPAADWGLMISENRSIISTNPMAVVAPVVALVLLIIGVNLLGDAYVRRLGKSGARG